METHISERSHSAQIAVCEGVSRGGPTMSPNPYHVRLTISQTGENFRAELFTEDLGDTEGDLLPARWNVLDEWMPFLLGGATQLPPDAARGLGQDVFRALL